MDVGCEALADSAHISQSETEGVETGEIMPTQTHFNANFIGGVDPVSLSGLHLLNPIQMVNLPAKMDGLQGDLQGNLETNPENHITHPIVHMNKNGSK